VTISLPTSGGCTLGATLEQDGFGMLWLHWPNLVTGKPQGRALLTAPLKHRLAHRGDHVG